MPAIRHASKRKAPPAGFSDIEDSLLVFANKMKDAENTPTTAAPKHQALWPIFQVSHQRSRYVWELYKQEKISKQLYEWLCKNGYADAMLIAKWKKDSYAKVSNLCGLREGAGANEKQLCCLRCIQTKETNFNSTCICRVPKSNLKEDQEVECVSCGCKGCASGD
ncbi:bud site selection protein 31 [Pseudogymnoascus sp. WSF 3629]|nr:bud site selection protein 31 [Pseudogymnoascus sp. WSF 3629]